MKAKKQVYVSYAWKVEEQKQIVAKLEQACQQRDIFLMLDKQELRYKDSIRNYMDQLAAGDAIILILSEAYFKSAYCMYELCAAHSLKDFQNRIFPIVVSGTSFHKTKERTPYIRYWQKETTELKEDLKTVDIENLGSNTHDEVKEYGEYTRVIDDLLSILGDMNTLTEDFHVDSDFDVLLNQIQPIDQDDDKSKPKRLRQSDQLFRKKIAEKMQKILVQQTNLSEALKETVSEDNIEIKSLVELLCNQEFETAIDDQLYPATKQCLNELDVNSSHYSSTWEAAKAVLCWLSLLVVRNEWVEDQEKLIDTNDLCFTVQVSTTTGIEIASARFRQFQPKLEAIPGKAEARGQQAILPSQLNPGWGKDMPLQRILIEIWNKVFPEDTRQPLIDKLSDVELGNLDYALVKREQRKTHHYYIPIPEDQSIAANILKELPSITVIYLTSSATEPTLRVENEGRFTSVIREFLAMNDNNGN